MSWRASPAGAMFAERARSHEAGFEVDAANAAAIAAVCRRLDGLPLALELAAARTPVLGVARASAARLGDALDLLTGGPRDAPERHRALRATIEWSYRLLGSDEAEAFARLAVFAGGSTVEAAEDVTGASLDTLAGLVDKHLLIRRMAPGGQPRLAMLETVREYALERLEDRDDAREVHARHCRHYRELAERAEPELFAEGETEWMPRLDAEIDNLRAAHDCSVAARPGRGAQAVPGLSTFWVLRDGLPEAMERADAALAAAGEEAPARERARAHVELAIAMGNRLLFDSEEWAKSRDAHATEALALFRGLDDQAGIGWALIVLAWPEQAASLPQRKRLELADEALRCGRAAGDSRLISLALVERALALPRDEADADFGPAEAALREVGNVWGLLDLYSGSVHNAIKVGEAARGGPPLAQALSLARALTDPVALRIAYATEGLYALFTGDIERAERAFVEQLRFCHDHWVIPEASPGLAGMAAAAASQGQDERAGRLLGAAGALGRLGDPDLVAQPREHFFRPARDRYGEPAWDEAQRVGAGLGFDEAIALAIGR